MKIIEKEPDGVWFGFTMIAENEEDRRAIEHLQKQFNTPPTPEEQATNRKWLKQWNTQSDT